MYTTGHKGGQGISGTSRYVHYWSQRGTGDYRDLQVCTLSTGHKGDRGLPGPPGLYSTGHKGDRGLPGPPGMYTTGHKGVQGITRTSRYVHYWSQRGTGDYRDLQVCTLLVTMGDSGLPGPPGMYTTGHKEDRGLTGPPGMYTTGHKGDRGLTGPPGMYTTGHKGGQGITRTSRYVHYWT